MSAWLMPSWHTSEIFLFATAHECQSSPISLNYILSRNRTSGAAWFRRLGLAVVRHASDFIPLSAIVADRRFTNEVETIAAVMPALELKERAAFRRLMRNAIDNTLPRVHEDSALEGLLHCCESVEAVH